MERSTEVVLVYINPDGSMCAEDPDEGAVAYYLTWDNQLIAGNVPECQFPN